MHPTRTALGLLALLAFSISPTLHATDRQSGPEKFAQLDYLLDTPTETRLASGAPGPVYWQQRADYDIEVTIDDRAQRLIGRETITYHNQSPHSLRYIWLQLDQNRFRPDSDDMLTKTAPDFEQFPYKTLANLLTRQDFEGGVDLKAIEDANGKALNYTVNKTMLRIDLAEALAPGEQFRFSVAWEHNIIDATAVGARGGYEYFEADENYLYEIAQWYPRVAAYTDYQGWQNKQFLGNGEFTLELGTFEVAITVPADHIVAATGVLQNPGDVLSRKQRQRYEKAQTSTEQRFIVTPEEAKQNESSRASVKKTWRFRAENVRDFAFASSRKFIWDARMAKSGSRDVLAMSFYPNEAEPLWSQYSTPAVAHTIDVYSRFTFEYPYPVSISVNGPVGGMEYPMITFNKPRPYKDGTYWDVRQKPDDKTWERSKYGLISVIIHEVGHNYFPMIVNSDERQWTWMDEGLNTFLQFVTEQAWEEEYPSRRGEPEKIVEYMISAPQVPIMTNSESIYQFGSNAYAKPATALNILRESIMGRELFDHAFREYATRWKFKRPTPADFFRSMEDASAVDLDWFWRGWFYGTEYVDVAVDNIALYQLDTGNPEVEKAWQKTQKDEREPTLGQQRNAEAETLLQRYPQLRDFYTESDEFSVTPWDYAQYEQLQQSLTDREKALLSVDKNFYAVTFRNIGGLVTPLPLRITYGDGEVEELQIPAEIWRRNANEVTKLFITDREITGIEFDPYRSTADADTANNAWPRKPETSRFKLFKEKEEPNPMRRDEQEKWEQPIY
ncbi:M1 family metallopeptidase [Parahaliea mediterranea]|uniref:M1 family metallopeptidase n=1 Tax=Parahaliea mediterranea TaxID=651086 RepID=A0A939ILK8_9GAMM|nr:M1 family metallopeptidase [Parahaliea mediterranea]MBN7796083.1 M1 family metallopeptidase [Parahaliea mediterranea]